MRHVRRVCVCVLCVSVCKPCDEGLESKPKLEQVLFMLFYMFFKKSGKISRFFVEFESMWKIVCVN